jgi:hypothetical protein
MTNMVSLHRIIELAGKLFNPKTEYQPKIVDDHKRIRGVLAGKVIFDTIEAKLVWEHKWFPQCVNNQLYR